MGLTNNIKALVTACAVSMAPAASAETLADTLAYAYDHSGLIEQNRALLRAADEGVAQAVAATMPGRSGHDSSSTIDTATFYRISAVPNTRWRTRRRR